MKDNEPGRPTPPEAVAGDNVEITVTGRISARGDDGVSIILDDGSAIFVPANAVGTVAIAEPVYVEGEAYRTRDGLIVLREVGGWRAFDGLLYAEDFPNRPLQRLVPEA